MSKLRADGSATLRVVLNWRSPQFSGEPKFQQLESDRGVAARRVMAGENAAAATGQRDAFLRLVRAAAFFGGRPPSRPLAREARAFASLRFAPTSAATPRTLTRVFLRPETRATRTRAAGRLAGCALRYSARTARMACSACACESTALSI